MYFSQGGSANVNEKELDRYKQLLLAKHREIEAGAIGTIGEAGKPGERQPDVSDQATEAAEMDLQVHLHQTDSHLLRAIEDALARIDRHTFGICETCHRPISAARLNAVPWTHLCRDCKEQQQT
jgi:DnaK suppressor protein